MKQLPNDLKSGYSADVKPMSLSESQEAALSRRTRLVIGATYLFPAQAFHSKKNDQSPTGFSNRAACFVLDASGSVVGITTISYSSLRAAYLGRVTENSEAPVVPSEVREGVNRPKAGSVSFISNIKGGQAPIGVVTHQGVKTAAITAPFALKVTGRDDFYTTHLEQREDGKYDMQINDNGTLAVETRSDYTMEYVAPTKEMLASMDMSQMSEIKSFLL